MEKLNVFYNGRTGVHPSGCNILLHKIKTMSTCFTKEKTQYSWGKDRGKDPRVGLEPTKCVKRTHPLNQLWHRGKAGASESATPADTTQPHHQARRDGS